MSISQPQSLFLIFIGIVFFTAMYLYYRTLQFKTAVNLTWIALNIKLPFKYTLLFTPIELAVLSALFVVVTGILLLYKPAFTAIWLFMFVIILIAYQEKKKEQWSSALDNQILDVIDQFVVRLQKNKPLEKVFEEVAGEIENKKPLCDLLTDIAKRASSGEDLALILKETAGKLEQQCIIFPSFLSHLSIAHSSNMPPNIMAILLERYGVLANDQYILKSEIQSNLRLSKYSRYLISSLPYVLIVVFYYIQPRFYDILINSFVGNASLIAASILIITGNLIGQKIESTPVILM